MDTHAHERRHNPRRGEAERRRTGTCLAWRSCWRTVRYFCTTRSASPAHAPRDRATERQKRERESERARERQVSGRVNTLLFTHTPLNHVIAARDTGRTGPGPVRAGRG
eukprot:3661219-Rhodomonas_salina.1